MKKLLFTGVVALAMFATSCTSDYTCTCNIDGVTQTQNYTNAKKSDAQAACDGLQTSAQLVTSSATCTLE